MYSPIDLNGATDMLKVKHVLKHLVEMVSKKKRMDVRLR